MAGEGVFHVVAATCVVRDDGRVLVTQRSAAKDHALRWEFPAGSVLSGESSAEGARRELQEETGLGAALGGFHLAVRLREERALLDVYVLRWFGDAALSLDPAEVGAAEWATWDHVEWLCREHLMANPWIDRLGAVGSELSEAVHAAGRSLRGGGRRSPPA